MASFQGTEDSGRPPMYLQGYPEDAGAAGYPPSQIMGGPAQTVQGGSAAGVMLLVPAPDYHVAKFAPAQSSRFRPVAPVPSRPPRGPSVSAVAIHPDAAPALSCKREVNGNGGVPGPQPLPQPQTQPATTEAGANAPVGKKKRKQHACPYCAREFTAACNLVVHLRVHTKAKPYECPVCHKRFSQTSNRTVHMRLHSGVKPFRCPHCTKSFGAKSNLKTHIRVHTGEKPYKCRVCGYAFSDASNRRVHERRKHSAAEVAAAAGAIAASSRKKPVPQVRVTRLRPALDHHHSSAGAAGSGVELKSAQDRPKLSQLPEEYAGSADDADDHGAPRQVDGTHDQKAPLDNAHSATVYFHHRSIS